MTPAPGLPEGGAALMRASIWHRGDAQGTWWKEINPLGKAEQVPVHLLLGLKAQLRLVSLCLCISVALTLSLFLSSPAPTRMKVFARPRHLSDLPSQLVKQEDPMR